MAAPRGRTSPWRRSARPIGNSSVRVQHLDETHCDRLLRAVAVTGDLAPIVLFRDVSDVTMNATTRRFYLADGHHRHHVYATMLERASIPAIVIESDAPDREALEFATMCNRSLCLGRTAADVTRAIEMLLADELWRTRSDSLIADHIGCGNTKVAVVRALDSVQRTVTRKPSSSSGKTESRNRTTKI